MTDEEDSSPTLESDDTDPWIWISEPNTSEDPMSHGTGITVDGSQTTNVNKSGSVHPDPELSTPWNAVLNASTVKGGTSVPNTTKHPSLASNQDGDNNTMENMWMIIAIVALSLLVIAALCLVYSMCFLTRRRVPACKSYRAPPQDPSRRPSMYVDGSLGKPTIITVNVGHGQ